MTDIRVSPCCKADTKIVDTRPYGYYVRRRRECPKCSRRFGTVEMLDMQSPRKKLAAHFAEFDDLVHSSDLDFESVGNWAYQTSLMFGSTEATAHLVAGTLLKGLAHDRGNST